MARNLFSRILLAGALALAPLVASAAVLKAPVVYDSGGRPIGVTPVICVDTTGTYLACGGGGGGGGGAVTVADGADVTQGAKADLAATSSVGSFNEVQLLKGLLAASLDPSSVAVKFDQATPGTTNGVVVNASALPAGAAISSKQATLDTSGAAIFPQSGTATRILTATTLTLNTNATICPTAANPVVTEIFFTTAGVGIGLNGQTLTAAVPGATTTNSPDIAIAAANTLYTAPVGISNAITAYGAAGVVRCIQTLRQ